MKTNLIQIIFEILYHNYLLKDNCTISKELYIKNLLKNEKHRNTILRFLKCQEELFEIEKLIQQYKLSIDKFFEITLPGDPVYSLKYFLMKKPRDLLKSSVNDDNINLGFFKSIRYITEQCKLSGKSLEQYLFHIMTFNDGYCPVCLKLILNNNIHSYVI